MSGAAKSFLPFEPINITDASLERLQLIEGVQAGHDFLLSIYAENEADKPKLQQLQQQLAPNKYSSFIEKDAMDRDCLRLHYMGRETGVVEGFAKLGGVGGAIHAAEAIANPIIDVAHKAADFTKYATAEPARLLSALYFIGDVLYANAGKGDSLEAQLMNASGKMAVLQSAIYMAFARDGSEYEISDIQKRIQLAIKEGKDLSDESLWDSPDDKQSFANNIVRFVRKEPIKLGAYAQMAGQGLLAASGAISIANGDKGGAWDIVRAATSITAWVMLQVDEHHVEQKTDWLKNPFARVMEEVQDSPHKYASTVNTAASLFGIKSSLSKMASSDAAIAALGEQIKANPADAILATQMNQLVADKPTNRQIAAEVTYLSGDLTMFFARKSEYGGDAANNTKGAAKAAAHFIAESQLLMSETPLREFVGNLSTYLARRIVHEKMRDGKLFQDETKAEIERISGELNRNIFSELAEKQSGYGTAANIIARISDLYPEEQQHQIEHQLILSLSSFTGANIEMSEMHEQINRQHDNFSKKQHNEPPAMSQISPLIVSLTDLLPSINAGANADCLYQTMLDFSKPQAQIATNQIKSTGKLNQPQLAQSIH